MRYLITVVVLISVITTHTRTVDTAVLPYQRKPAEQSFTHRSLCSRYTITVEATAYTWTGSKTATGTYPRRGTIAADPTVIPLGTRVFVEGYGFGVIEDTGGAIQGNRIDVYFPTYEEAVQFGRRTVSLTIIR